ncbi:hypothetical protein X740_27995 [Mesorhizobium sp. LNHC221B00]|nr:hypothetical protein X740_27995 [Mesorhizobium sp. LNHC221B00]
MLRSTGALVLLSNFQEQSFDGPPAAMASTASHHLVVPGDGQAAIAGGLKTIPDQRCGREGQRE